MPSPSKHGEWARLKPLLTFTEPRRRCIDNLTYTGMSFPVDETGKWSGYKLAALATSGWWGLGK